MLAAMPRISTMPKACGPSMAPAYAPLSRDGKRFIALRPLERRLPRRGFGALDIAPQRALQADQHEDERLVGDPDEQRADEVDDLRLLQGRREPPLPGLAARFLLAEAPADPLHLPHPEPVQQQPEEQAEPALLAEHLEVRRVIGARLVGDLVVLDRAVVAFADDLAGLVGEAVAEIGIEAAAERVLL